MKRKPDSIASLFFLFCLGLAVSGFASIEKDNSKKHEVAVVTQFLSNSK
jgi:hypothetical protein